MRIWSLILLCLFVSVPATAAEDEKELGFWFETQVVGNGSQRFIGWYERDLSDKFGFYAFAEKESDGYKQFYLGPKAKPFDWLTVGIGVGREFVPDESTSIRRSAYLNAELEKMSVWAIFENGGSGAWHKVTATYALNDRWGVGLMKETDLGFGPRVEYNIKKDVQFWIAVLRGGVPNSDGIAETRTTAVLGFNFSF